MNNNNQHQRKREDNCTSTSSSSSNRSKASSNRNQMHHSRTKSNLNYKIDPDNMGAQFYMNHIRSYSGVFPKFSQPKEIGAFSSEKRIEVLSKKNIKNEDKSASSNKINTCGVKYLVLPETYPTCNFDLNVGISEFVEHIPHQHGIDSVLKWIIANKKELLTSLPSSPDPNVNKQGIKADIVCWRGLLTKILSAPYERQNDFMFTVIYYKKTHYLCEIETQKQYNERINCPDKLKQFMYWGHKFETYITSDTVDGTTEADSVADPEDYYSTVVQSRLGTLSLLYSAEVDCCINSDHKSLDNYCEIKTTRGNSIEDVDVSRNFKFMKWWLQSFLIDTRKLLIGLRDDNGMVKKLAKYTVSNLQKEAQSWDASVCFNFLEEFLSFIKIYCCEENCTYIIERQTNSSIINCRKTFERNQYFLRDWYTSEV